MQQLQDVGPDQPTTSFPGLKPIKFGRGGKRGSFPAPPKFNGKSPGNEVDQPSSQTFLLHVAVGISRGLSVSLDRTKPQSRSLGPSGPTSFPGFSLLLQELAFSVTSLRESIFQV